MPYDIDAKMESIQKAPSFVLDNEEVSGILKDPTEEGRSKRHVLYRQLADASDEIDGGTDFKTALDRNVSDEFMPSGTGLAYHPEPEDKVVVYGRHDPSTPVEYDEWGAPVGNLRYAAYPIDAARAEDKRSYAKDRALNILQDAAKGQRSAIMKFIVDSALQGGPSPEKAPPNTAMEDAIRQARTVLQMGGYSDEEIEQVLGAHPVQKSFDIDAKMESIQRDAAWKLFR